MNKLVEFMKGQQLPGVADVADDLVEGILKAKEARGKILADWQTRSPASRTQKAIANRALSGNGIRVAILDSGMISNQQIVEAHRLTRHDLTNEEGDAEDHTPTRHGSTMAGIIGGKVEPESLGGEDEIAFEGIAPRCNLHIVKCFARNGKTPWPKIREGLEHVREYNRNHPSDPIRIVLMAVEELVGKYDSNFEVRPTDSIAKLIRELREEGVVFVVSSGNQGNGDLSMSYPAILFHDVISVGAIYATTPRGVKRLRKPTERSQLIPGKTTILAPGWGVKVNLGRNRLDIKGTSTAAALVAGAVALIMEFIFVTQERYPGFEEVREILVAGNSRLVVDDQRGVPTEAAYPLLDIFHILSKLSTQ